MSRPEIPLYSENPKKPPGNLGQHRGPRGEAGSLWNQSLTHETLALLEWLGRQDLSPEDWENIDAEALEHVDALMYQNTED